MSDRRTNKGRQEMGRRNTGRTKAIYARAMELLPGGVESNFRLLDPFPFYVARAKGPRIYDVDGNEYMDFLLSQGAILLGHSKKEVADIAFQRIGS